MRKAGQGVGGAAAAFAIGIGGYVSGASVQSDSAIVSVRVAAGGIPIVTLLIAGVVMLAYPLTEKMYRRIIGDLAERRADTAFTPSGSATTASEDRTT
jgi:glucuronide carrier protein